MKAKTANSYGNAGALTVAIAVASTICACGSRGSYPRPPAASTSAAEREAAPGPITPPARVVAEEDAGIRLSPAAENVETTFHELYRRGEVSDAFAANVCLKAKLKIEDWGRRSGDPSFARTTEQIAATNDGFCFPYVERMLWERASVETCEQDVTLAACVGVGDYVTAVSRDPRVQVERRSMAKSVYATQVARQATESCSKAGSPNACAALDDLLRERSDDPRSGDWVEIRRRAEPALDRVHWNAIVESRENEACAKPAHADACATVNGYLRAHPRGAHAKDVQALLSRAQPRLDALRKADARAAASSGRPSASSGNVVSPTAIPSSGSSDEYAKTHARILAITQECDQVEASCRAVCDTSPEYHSTGCGCGSGSCSATTSVEAAQSNLATKKCTACKARCLILPLGRSEECHRGCDSVVCR
jgi:hypothetical protein